MPIKGKTRITTQFNKIPDSFNTEFVFFKQRSKYAKVVDVSGRKLEKDVIADSKKEKKYIFKPFLHGHSHIIRESSVDLLGTKSYLIPSPEDIFSIYSNYKDNPKNYSHVITIRDLDKKMEAGRVHIMLMPESIKKIEELLKNMLLISDNTLYSELIDDKYTLNEIEKIFNDSKKKLMFKQNYTLRNILYLKGMFSSHKLLQYYVNYLNIKFRYVPNKREGYYFKEETMEFLKK